MVDRRAYIAWVLSRPLALTLDIVRQIMRAVVRDDSAASRINRVVRGYLVRNRALGWRNVDVFGRFHERRRAVQRVTLDYRAFGFVNPGLDW